MSPILGVLLLKYTFAGIYLSLDGVNYANNSVISITEIEENQGLECITDEIPCCTGTGEWYFPNGTVVPGTSALTFYSRIERDDGAVNLNRLNSHVMSPTGQFCCVVSDATLTYQTLCAFISKLHDVCNFQ